MGDHFDAEWRRSAVPDDFPRDQVDVFVDAVDGLMPPDHDYLLLAGVVREMVSAYEVYVGDAFAEVVERHGLPPIGSAGRMPGWRELKPALKILRLRPLPKRVGKLLRLRDLLTHARGRLRSAKDREVYARDVPPGFRDDVAYLDEERVLNYLGVLNVEVERMDPVLWQHSWGGKVIPDFEARLLSALPADDPGGARPFGAGSGA